MKNSKLIEVLGTFSKEEIKAFGKFVRSPYFNIGRNVEGLFFFLKDHHPEFEPAEIEKEKVFDNLFPGKEYNGKTIRNLSSYLTLLAEQFLVCNSVLSDQAGFEKLLAVQYKEREKEKLFLSTIKSLDKRIDELLFDSETCFSTEEEVIILKEEFYLGKNRFDKSIVLRGQYTEYFTLTFLVLFLKKLRDKEIIPYTYGTPFDNVLLDSMYKIADFEELLSLLKKEKYPMLWLIEMYYYSYLSSKDLDDEKSFYKYKKLFSENMEYFSRKEKYYMLSDFIDFYIRNENRGEYKYEQEELEAYKQMLEEDAYSPSQKEYMNIVVYRNMMLLALSLKEYEWLGGLIKEFTGKLKPEYRDNMKSFARAYLDFARGNYEEALENISKVKYDLFTYKLDVKNLLLKIYYEMELYDQGFSLIDTYKHYLKENKELPASYMLQFQNFIGIYNKLLKAKADGETGEPGILIKEINSFKTLSSRGWMLEKISELEKGN